MAGSALLDPGLDTTMIEEAYAVDDASVSWASALQSATGPKLASRACEDAVRIWKLYSGSWRMKCFLDLQLHSKEASNGVSDVAWTTNLGPPEKVLLKMVL
ncbi:transport protein SEC13-like protein B [Nymphaea thermarum]|nr:transport protein SEC13-like protein B [Nymphaea thermarum]